MIKPILKVLIGNPLMRAVLTNETMLSVVLGLFFWGASVVPLFVMSQSPSLAYIAYGVALLIAALIFPIAHRFVQNKEDGLGLVSGFTLGFGLTVTRIPLDAVLSFCICKLSTPLLSQDTREELFLALCLIYFMQLVIPWYLGFRSLNRSTVA